MHRRASIGENTRTLESGQQLVAVTPGRLLDMIKGRRLRAESINILVFDEADEPLNVGSKQQICEPMDTPWPPTTQIILLSATLPRVVRNS